MMNEKRSIKERKKDVCCDNNALLYQNRSSASHLRERGKREKESEKE